MVRTRRSAVSSAAKQPSTSITTSALKDKTNINSNVTLVAAKTTSGAKSKYGGKITSVTTKKIARAAQEMNKVVPDLDRNIRAPTSTTSVVARQFAPARSVHRPSRLNRKPFRTVDSLKKNAALTQPEEIEEVASQQSLSKRSRNHPLAEPRPSTSPRAASNANTMSSSPSGDAENVHPDGTQNVAESVYQSSNVPSATPSGLGNSMLVLKNFRRRPRQPSMLNMVKQRLASARSSLAGGAPELAIELSEDELSDFDLDFMPDAVGTPMYSSGVDSMGIRTADEASQHESKRKRASEDVDGLLDSPRLKQQRRGPTDVTDREEHADNDTVSREHDQDVDDHIAGTLVTDRSSRSESASPSRDKSAALSPVYASSSPGESLGIMNAGSQSSVYGPPVSQHTPPPQRQTRARRDVAPPSTAILQSLLPKRRRQVFTTYPIPALKLPVADDNTNWEVDFSSSIEGESSEFVQAKTGSKNVRRANTKALRPGVRSTSRAPLPQISPNAVRQMRKDNTTDRAQKGRLRGAKTYSHHKANDKENHTLADLEQDDDIAAGHDTTTMDEATKSSELEKARKKFAEVDEWEMEFEVVTTEESRTSSQGWR